MSRPLQERGNIPDAKSTAVTESELTAAVDRICSSERFRKSPVLRDLLSFLYRNQGNPLTEYAIGTEALGRRPDFDSRTDASVRVHMSRLRQRLRDYYDTEDPEAVFRLVIPAGTYRVELQPSETAPNPPGALPGIPRHWFWLAAVLAVVCCALGLDNWRLRTVRNVQPRKPHPFWASFATGPVDLIVPAPLFFLFGNLVVRDLGVNLRDSFESSPRLRDLRDKLGSPETSRWYTITSDTVAAASLSQYLQDHGIAASVADAPTVSMSKLGTRNSVVLVGPGTFEHAEELLAGMNFHLRSLTHAVLNRQPAAGEPGRWVEVEHAPLRSTGYGIVARLPGRLRDTETVLLASRFNVALSALLTTAHQLDVLEDYRRSHGAPPYYEMVVEYERNGDTVLRAKPIALRRVAHAPAKQESKP